LRVAVTVPDFLAVGQLLLIRISLSAG
jgi:hypothetical protein